MAPWDVSLLFGSEAAVVTMWRVCPLSAISGNRGSPCFCHRPQRGRRCDLEAIKALSAKMPSITITRYGGDGVDHSLCPGNGPERRACVSGGGTLVRSRNPSAGHTRKNNGSQVFCMRLEPAALSLSAPAAGLREAAFAPCVVSARANAAATRNSSLVRVMSHAP